MATIDELILKFDAKGADKLIKQIKDISDAIEGTASNYDKLGNSTQKSQKAVSGDTKKRENELKKKAKTENKYNKSTLEANKKINSGLEVMAKRLAPLIAYGSLLSLAHKGASYAKPAQEKGTDLYNQSVATNFDTKDLETIQTASKALGLNATAFDDLIKNYSDHINKFKAGMGGNEDFLVSTAMFNGYERNGYKIDPNTDDSITLLKKIHEALQAEKDAPARNVLAQSLGLGTQATTALLRQDFKEALDKAVSQSIMDQSKAVTLSEQNKKQAEAEKNRDNAVTEAGIANAPAKVATTKAEENNAKTIKNIAPYTNVFASMYEKITANIEEATRYIGSGEFIINALGAIDGFSNSSKSIKSTLSDKNKKPSLMDEVKKSTEENHQKELKEQEERQRQEVERRIMKSEIIQDRNYQSMNNNINNNQSQVINIEELHINTSANNLDGMISEVRQKVSWTFEGMPTSAEMMPYGSVIS